MNAIALSFPTNGIERLGWVLIHSLWQFALLGLLALLLTRAARQCSSAARYVILLAAMSLMLLAPAVTWRVLPGDATVGDATGRWPRQPDANADARSTVVESASTPTELERETGLVRPETPDLRSIGGKPTVSRAAAAPWGSVTAEQLRPWLYTLVWAWCAGVVMFSFRLLLGWRMVRRLSRVGISPAPDGVRIALEQAARRLRLRQAVEVLQSAVIRAPVVVGYLRPVILLPMSLVTGLSARELEAILAHELAHVRRHDFLVNVLQTLVETVFFYHPAVWWLSGRIRMERENCCDDLAIQVLGNRIEYGRALVAVEELRGTATTLALSMRGGSLRYRIRRILGLPAEPPSTTGNLTAIALMIVAVLAAASWALLPVDANTALAGGALPLDEVSQPQSDPQSELAGGGSDQVNATNENAWGPAVNGLRSRIVPVLASMSEEAIDPAQRVTRFERAEDVALVVEMENVSDRPIKLIDTRYGEDYGEAKGKANSNRFAPFLFTIDYFDADGQPVERPDVQVVDLDNVLGHALVMTLDAGQTHRFLLRPAEWLGITTHRLQPGLHRVAVRYHGLPERVAKRIREYRPDSPVLDVVAGDIISLQVPFEVAGVDDTVASLVWGEPSNGLRAAVEFVPHRAVYVHGDKPEIKLHVQNVSTQPITFSSRMWLSDLLATAENDRGEPIAINSTWYSGWKLTSRVTLQPQQTAIYDAGNIGLAEPQALFDTFEHVTHRKLIAPAGKYALRLSGLFGKDELKDGADNVLAPLAGDWTGTLTTGPAPLTIEAHPLAAWQERIPVSLPDWLKPLYNNGLVAVVDDEGYVISVAVGDPCTDELLARFATLPRLRELDIGSTNALTSAGLARLAELKTLEKLNLHNVNVGGKGLGDAAIEAIRGLESLRELLLSECGTTDTGARLLESMQQLTRLSLHEEGLLTDEALTSIGKLKQLKHLSLKSYAATEAYGWMHFSEEGIRELAGLDELEELHLVGHPVPADALAFPRLTALSLGGTGVNDDCATQIAKCRDLERLSLVNTAITDVGLAMIAALPVLQQFKLDSRHVTDTGIVHLKGFQNLQHLDLRASRVTNEALGHLAAIPTLTRLDLHGSGYFGIVTGERFTLAGLQRLKVLPNLHTLYLANWNSTAGYLGLKELPQLRELSLMMCDIRADELEALRSALPHTSIHAASGGSSWFGR